MITGYRYTTAKVHDSQCMDALIKHEKRSVIADSAYIDFKRKKRLEARAVFRGIVRRRRPGEKRLSETWKVFNRAVSSLRAPVEHPPPGVAWIKSMGHRRARYRGLRRNTFDFAMMAIAYNFKRSLSLVET